MGSFLILCLTAADPMVVSAQPAPLQQAIERARTGSPEERAAACETLGRRNRSERGLITPVLRQRLREDRDWRVRASAGRAIGRIGSRTAVPDLVRALRDPNVDVRVVAAAAIWRLPDPAAVPALLTLLADDDRSARQWGALALGVIGDRRAMGPLAGLLNDAESQVRVDAIRSLGRLRDAHAVAPLEAFILDPSHATDERLEAVTALTSLPGPEKVDALVRLLSFNLAPVRMRVAESLGGVGDALTIASLQRRRPREQNQAIRETIEHSIVAIQERLAGRTTTSPGSGVPLNLPPPP